MRQVIYWRFPCLLAIIYDTKPDITATITVELKIVFISIYNYPFLYYPKLFIAQHTNKVLYHEAFKDSVSA